MTESAGYIEKDLLKRVASGDETAFGDLFYKYKDRLYSFIVGLSRSEQQAEDILQDVFLKIWQSREKLTEINDFDSYIMRIARNHTIDQFRRLQKESAFLKSFSFEGHLQDSPEESLVFKQAEDLFQKAVDNLPEQQRKVYLLHREGKLKHIEIAHELGLSVSTVQNHMFRAMENIRKYLTNVYSDAGSYIMIAGALSIYISEKNFF